MWRASGVCVLVLGVVVSAGCGSSDDQPASGDGSTPGAGGATSVGGSSANAGAGGAHAGASGKGGSGAAGQSNGGNGGSASAGKGGASGASGKGGASGAGGASGKGGGGSPAVGPGGMGGSTGGAATGGNSQAGTGGTGAGGDSGGAPGGGSPGTGGGGTTGTGGNVAMPTACSNPPCLNVVNGCPFPLWIHAKSNAGVTLTPDDAQLQPGDVRQYDMPADWPAARVNAYWEDPGVPASDPNAYEKVELTVGNGQMNYNITYVDYVGLPSKMEAVGPACQKTGNFDPAVGCPVKADTLLAGCPPGLLAGKRCLSAGQFCADSNNKDAPFCHVLDDALTACESMTPECGIAASLMNTTANVYGCSGYFDSQPPNCSPASASCHKDGNKWCAALNRGMLANPDSTDTSQFYQGAYNAYSKWVHDTCPGIYAFPYDDYPSGAGESGFRSCAADRLDVTFCPGG